MTIGTGAKPKEDLVVIITRMFDAPRELVFQAFNDPKHIVPFLGPNGFTSTVRELDPRPGGAFRIDMRALDGATYLCEGVYREIIVPQRIVLSGDPDCGHPCGGGLPPGALVAITLPSTAARRSSRYKRASNRKWALTRQWRWVSTRVGRKPWTALRLSLKTLIQSF
jgi:uncharacterized protein YndB with AHSA1/START domain